MVTTVDIVKETLTAREVAEFYGMHVTDKGFCCCPFHNEKTPSMQLYRGQGGFYCFGCGKGGDIITFVQLLFNIDFKTALFKLCTDFNIPCDDLSTYKNNGTQARLEALKQQRKDKQSKLETLERYKNERYDAWVSACIKLEEFTPCKKSLDDMMRLTALMIDKENAEMELNRAEFELNEYRLQSANNTIANGNSATSGKNCGK